MASWKQATSDPITTEREVRVYNTETGEEGYISLTWENQGHNVRFFGSVCKVERYYDESGVEFLPLTRMVIDQNPVFVD